MSTDEIKNAAKKFSDSLEIAFQEFYKSVPIGISVSILSPSDFTDEYPDLKKENCINVGVSVDRPFYFVSLLDCINGSIPIQG